MLGSVFGFRGHITGIQYFLGLVAVVVASVLGVSVFYDVAQEQTGDVSSLALDAIALITPLFAVLLIWVQLSLTTRRLRDIGLNPALTIGAWLLVTVIDSLVAFAAPTLSVTPLRLQTPVGELIAMAVTLFLIFWPSRRDERYVAPSGAIYRD